MRSVSRDRMLLLVCVIHICSCRCLRRRVPMSISSAPEIRSALYRNC